MKPVPTHILVATLLPLLPFPSGIRAEEAPTPPVHAAQSTGSQALGNPQAYQQRLFPADAKDAHDQLHYKWLAPLDQKPELTYPLVVCLHGRGGGVGCSRILAQTDMRRKFPAFVMLPESPRPYVWAHADIILKDGAPSPIDGPEKYAILIEAIRSLMKTEAIDRSRVYITGQSLGGVGTWGAIARNPELFAAAVPVCGAWKVADAPKMTTVPIWAFHGEVDPTVPIHWSRDLTEAVTKAGGSARFTHYPGVGHDSWTKAYQDTEMWQWLFAQKK